MTDENLPPPPITTSTPIEGGLRSRRFERVIASIACPICGMLMGAITNRHLAVRHGLSTIEFRRLYPNQPMQPPENRRVASTRAKATIQASPEKRERQRQVIAIMQEASADRSPEQMAAAARKAAATMRKRFTPQERSAFARQGGLAVLAQHPEQFASMGAKSAPFWNSPQGKALASARAIGLWADPAHRKNIATKNRQAALDGRIRQKFTRSRPSKHECRMIAFVERAKLPLQYVGDGEFRIEIPNGNRHWRNPDFLVIGQRKIVLLDTQFKPGQQPQEDMDYRLAGWAVLRVSVPELTDERWLKRKLRTFILSGLSGSEPSLTPDLFTTSP